MEKIITMENLRYFAYCNHNVCKKPIKGIAISFFGLSVDKMYLEDTREGWMFGDEGILYVVPYQNPWAWQNKQNVDYTDEILDVLFKEFDLPEDLPIVSEGGSMGGLQALVYMIYSKRTPVACVANCPVCDLPYHYTERVDLPRTLYSAFFNYKGTLQDAMESASPIHLVDKLPTSADYYIFHCEKDGAVNKQKHSDRFIEKFEKNHKVKYYSVPDRDHCDLPDDVRELYFKHMMDAIRNR